METLSIKEAQERPLLLILFSKLSVQEMGAHRIQQRLRII